MAIFVDPGGEIFALGDGESPTGKESRLAGKQANAIYAMTLGFSQERLTEGARP